MDEAQGISTSSYDRRMPLATPTQLWKTHAALAAYAALRMPEAPGVRTICSLDARRDEGQPHGPNAHREFESAHRFATCTGLRIP